MDVPQLAESDVVAYDRENREVSLEPLPEPLSRILCASREYDREHRSAEADEALPEP